METEAEMRHPTGRASGSRRVWNGPPPVVGMVHLLPLPGSPGYGGSMASVLARATKEATLLTEGGLDGLLLENYGDAPFYPDRVPPETVAAMAVVVRKVVGCTPLPVGVNVLRNDAEAAVAVAAATGARFIRVNVHTGTMFSDQGLLEGKAHRTLRIRQRLAPTLSILADIMVKHATAPPGLTLESAANDAWVRGRADGLILTGARTGDPVDPDELRRVREVLPSGARVWAGSGVSPDTVPVLLKAADGIIVGSALHRDGVAGTGLDPARVRDLRRALGRS